MAKATTASSMLVANEQPQQVKQPQKQPQQVQQPQEQPQPVQQPQKPPPPLRRRQEEEQREEEPAVKRHGGSKHSEEDVADEVAVGVRVRRKYHGHGTYNGTVTAVVDGQVAVAFEHEMDGIDFSSGFSCPFFQRACTLTAVVIIKWKNPRQSRKSAPTATPAGPQTRARGAWAVTSRSIPWRHRGGWERQKKGEAGAATCVSCRSSGDIRSQKSSQEETENMTHNMTLVKNDITETPLCRQAPLS